MDELNKILFRESLVNKILVELFLKDVEVEVSEGSKKGDNYMGYIKRVTIKKENTTSSWIMKLGIMENRQREVFKVNKIYIIESLCYQKIFPVLSNFQDKFNFEENDKFKHAKCLMTCTDENFEAIIMDDLAQYGYRTVERKKYFNFEKLQIVIKNMANLHSLSYAMKEKNPTEYEKIANELVKNKHMDQYIVEMVNESLKQAKDIISNDQSRERFNNLFPGALNVVSDLTECDNSNPYYAIIQGDCWVKNMMFKFEDDKPVDLIFIDWQLCKITSPVLDLSVILFMNTDCLTRRKYFKQCLDLYYSHLGKKLELMGCDIAKCFPRYIYEEHIKRFSLYGIFMGILIANFMHSDGELEIADLGEGGAIYSYCPESIKQINEIVEDAILFNLI